MKKDHVLVPEPSSKFNKVKCHECESEQIVYSHSSTPVSYTHLRAHETR